MRELIRELFRLISGANARVEGQTVSLSAAEWIAINAAIRRLSDGVQLDAGSLELIRNELTVMERNNEVTGDRDEAIQRLSEIINSGNRLVNMLRER